MDQPTWRQLAQQMAHDQLRSRGIDNERVLQAMICLPRHRFLPPDSDLDPAIAYDDRALPIGQDQTISQPYIVAWMTAQLDVEPQQKTLEIGTGCGYQAAVLAKLGAHVITIERHQSLARRAAATLRELGLADQIHFIIADGTLGYPPQAPYDRIIVTAGAPALPPALHAQLKPQGRIVIPIGDRKHQRLVAYQEHHGKLIEVAELPCRFVPLIGEAGW